MFYELTDIKREKESENQEEILTKKDKKSFIYLELKGLKGSKGEVVLSKGNRFFIFSEAVARRCSVKKASYIIIRNQIARHALKKKRFHVKTCFEKNGATVRRLS